MKLDLNYSKLVCDFSKKYDCDMSLSSADNRLTSQNRIKFLRTLDIDPGDLVFVKQTHSAKVVFVDQTTKENCIPEADGLVTNCKNIALAVFTADCLSIFLYDAINSSIGLLHAGWRGTKDNIASEAIRLMQRKFNTDPSNLRVGFGPCIRECCYQVSDQFKDSFAEDIIEKEGKYYLDLISINKKQLIAAGVKEDNISDCGICTLCESDGFFSYRKDRENAGRMMSVIMLKG